MPLSDNVKQFLQSFLSNAMLTPAQQEAKRQAGAAAAEHQREFGINTDFYNRQLAQQRDIETMKSMFDAVLRGGKVGPATQQGGPGLNSTTPQTADSGTPNVGGPPPQEGVGSLSPFFQMFGMQGATGQNSSAVPPSLTTPGSRMAGPNPAAPAKPIMPTVGNILPFTGPGGAAMQLEMPAATEDQTVEFNLPKAMTGAGKDQTLKLPVDKEHAPIIDTLAKLYGTQAKPTKLATPEAQMKSAAFSVATAHGLDAAKFEHPNDLPTPELQKEAWSNYNDIRMTDLEKQQKQQMIEAEKEKNKQFAEARASDSAVMDLIKRDPMYFDHKHIPDQKQYDRILSQAQAQGVKLPTRQPTPKMEEDGKTADELQMQVKRIESLAQQVGWQNFGAIIGRLKIGEGKVGEPLITIDKPSAKGTPQAQLESELRDHLNFLTLQETKLFGGGRTAVMLVNMVKSTSPQQWQSQPLFQGAVTAAYNRAQMTKNAIKRYAFGDTDEASAQTGMAAAGGPLPKDHFVGERVYHPGQKKFYTVKEVLPGNKIRTEEE